MYNHLVDASVYTSADMSTKLVVKQDSELVKVESAKAALIFKHDSQGLSITLPADRRERRQCMRGQLPGALADDLEVFDSRGERQIYRILNELESGTDDILLNENISHVDWLTPISRPATSLDPEDETQAQVPVGYTLNQTTEQNGHVEGQAQAYLEVRQVETTIRAAASLPIYGSGGLPRPLRTLPTQVNHETEAPLYWKVLEHVRKQAESLGNDLRNVTGSATVDDLTNELASLGLDRTSFEPDDFPSLFGNDFWMSNFRVGAAGELFVS